jgi:immune inhibitor A
MRNLSRFAWCVLVSLFFSIDRGGANSASPFPIEVEQPNGQEITLYLRGTEKLHWYEFVPEAAQLSLESFDDPRNRELAKTPGYTVVQDEVGWYVFAEIDEAGRWAPSKSIVGTDEPVVEQRRLMPPPEEMTEMAMSQLPESALPPRAAAPAGEVHNLVVLMRFADHEDRTLPSREDFDKLFNASGGDAILAPTGSVQDFYRENSYGKLTLKSAPTVWITLPKSEAYYANKKSGLDVRVREAMVDALDIIARDGLVSFADFDNENGGTGDGWIDAITFVHSGYAAEFGGIAGGADVKDRIWSHRWVINTWTDPVSGVRVRDYNINPGLWGTSDNKIGRIGVICHELGHFFGLPDLYDYSGVGEGAGSWCLMANSWGFDGTQWHPPHMSVWSKTFLTWMQPQLISTAGTYKVSASSTSEANCYRVNFPSGSPDEYLLIENRQPLGNFDGGIPTGTGGSGGLLIWHIDDAKTANDEPGYPGQPGWPGKHYWVGLLQADGKYDLEKGTNRGDADDPYREGHVTVASPTTAPSTNNYTGVAGPTIQKISKSDREMTFQVGDVVEEPFVDDAAFAGHTYVQTPESHVSSFSPDGKAATLLFDRLEASQFGRVHTGKVAASFTLRRKGGAAKAAVFLRGFAVAAEGSAVGLVVQLGGKTQVIDLLSVRDASSNVEKLQKSTQSRIEEFQEERGLTEGFSWTVELTVNSPAETDLTVTTVLLTEKFAKESDGAYLVVDSLDVELLSDGAGGSILAAPKK